MKKFLFSLSFLTLVFLSGCNLTPTYAPKSLNGYVIDMLTTKTVEEESGNKREVYRYRFSEKTYKATSASYPSYEGNYNYTVLNPQKARLICSIQKSGNKANRMTLTFQDTSSGTWTSLDNNNTPGEQGGTFVVVQKGDTE